MEFNGSTATVSDPLPKKTFYNCHWQCHRVKSMDHIRAHCSHFQLKHCILEYSVHPPNRHPQQRPLQKHTRRFVVMQ